VNTPDTPGAGGRPSSGDARDARHTGHAGGVGDGGTIHLPQPSVWPATLAAGITLLLFGVVGGVFFGASGAALIALALAGWIGELRRD
jgi:hypothetical protein